MSYFNNVFNHYQFLLNPFFANGFLLWQQLASIAGQEGLILELKIVTFC